MTIARMKVRRGTAASAAATNPVLASGEIGYETDTGVAKIGDGISAWATLSALVDLDVLATVMATQTITVGNGLTGGGALLPGVPVSLGVDFGTSSTKVAAGNRGLPAGGTTNQMLVKTSGADYAVGWVDQPSGGSGGLLVQPTNYLLSASLTTTSNVLSDIAASSLVTTFTVPASGRVLVTLTADVTTSATNQYIWGLREGTTTLVENTALGGLIVSGLVVTRSFLITGLTPGASKTYKWAHRTLGGTAGLFYNGAGIAQRATMEVIAA